MNKFSKLLFVSILFVMPFTACHGTPSGFERERGWNERQLLLRNQANPPKTIDYSGADVTYWEAHGDYHISQPLRSPDYFEIMRMATQPRR